MIYRLENPEKVAHLFAGCDETIVRACLEKTMGYILVTDSENPKSACAFGGCIGFYAGKPDRELASYDYGSFFTIIPLNDEWNNLIEECRPDARRITRYAIRKDPKFDRKKLESYRNSLPEGYEIKKIDSEIHDLCLLNEQTVDFVKSFDSKEAFLKNGIGYAVLKNGEVVGGASSFIRYSTGIEIEVDVVKSERRKGLAAAACSTLILECLDRGLYPSWDAQNMASVKLSEKLGYRLSHEYTAYEVNWQDADIFIAPEDIET